LLALLPTNRIVPTTSTKIIAIITAYRQYPDPVDRSEDSVDMFSFLRQTAHGWNGLLDGLFQLSRPQASGCSSFPDHKLLLRRWADYCGCLL